MRIRDEKQLTEAVAQKGVQPHRIPDSIEDSRLRSWALHVEEIEQRSKAEFLRLCEDYGLAPDGWTSEFQVHRTKP
jgi:hypothetical protein